MKKLLVLVALAFASTAFAGGEMKEVCTDVVKRVRLYKNVRRSKYTRKLKVLRFQKQPKRNNSGLYTTRSIVYNYIIDLDSF